MQSLWLLLLLAALTVAAGAQKGRTKAQEIDDRIKNGACSASPSLRLTVCVSSHEGVPQRDCKTAASQTHALALTHCA